MEGFSPNLSDPEARFRAIEDELQRLRGLVGDVHTQVEQRTVLIPQAGLGVLLGDVTGVPQENKVEQIQNVPIPAPVAGDDEKIVAYESTGTTFKYSNLVGDVSGGVATTSVDKIKGKAVDTPALGDDAQFARYNHGAGTISWETPAGTGSAKCFLHGWARDDISALTGTFSELFNSFSKGTNNLIPFVSDTAGTITALCLVLDGDIGGVGDDIIVEIYKNGAGTGQTATLSGGAGSETFVTTPVTVTYAADDEITLFAKKAGAPSARSLVASIYGTIN